MSTAIEIVLLGGLHHHPSRNWDQGRCGGESRVEAVLGGASDQRLHDGWEKSHRRIFAAH